MPKWAKLLSLASVAAAVLVVIMTPLTSLADGQWSAVSTLTPRLRYAVTTVGSKVLIAGGEKYVGGREGIAYFVQVDIYDSATGNWSSATLAEPRSGMVAATVGSKALLYGRRGGLDYVDTVDIYDSESDTWSVTHLPDVVNLPAMFTVRDQVIVLGTPKTPGADIANVYDTTTDTWTSTQLPDRPIDPIALVAGDVALVGTGAGGAWDTLDLFDATTRQWSTVKLSQARSSPSTAIAGSLILIAGGSTDGRPSDVVDIYDASTRSLTSAHLSEARIVGTSAVANGHVIFAGGSNKHMEKVDNSFVERGGASDVVDIFTVVTGEWSVSRMPHSAYQPQAVAVGTHALFAGITTSGPTDALRCAPEPPRCHGRQPGPVSRRLLPGPRPLLATELRRGGHLR